MGHIEREGSLDCLALLEFPLSLVEEKGLIIGDRPLTIITNSVGATISSDLENGANSYNR